MRRILLFLIAALLLVASVPKAQESVSLTSPASVGTRSTWEVNYLHIELKPSVRIAVEVVDNLGNIVRDEHTSTTATTGATLLAALNTANLSAGNSLMKRILTHLQSEGKIGAGSVIGSPQ